MLSESHVPCFYTFDGMWQPLVHLQRITQLIVVTKRERSCQRVVLLRRPPLTVPDQLPRQ